MQIASRHIRIAGLVVSSLLLICGLARADTRDIPRIDADLTRLELKLENLAREYGGRDVLSQTRAFDDRFADAEILYLLGDYTRASLLLFELVGDTGEQENQLFPKAIYYLAESQYQIGNDLAARNQFRRLVMLRRPENLSVAVKRLIQLADRLERWEGLDDQVSVLRTRGRLPPSIAYIHAKSLLRRGLSDAVAAAVSDIDSKHTIWAKARYLVGVGLLLQRELDGAHAVFTELTKIDDHFDDSASIRELSAMNRGRILMEQGRLGQSIDAYQFVSRDSSHFEESLYEITWLYVRAASESEEEAERRQEFTKALKALEILLLSEQATTLAPEARLLLGNVQLRLGSHNAAVDVFDEVVERYAPVRDELRRLSERVTDPAAYYDEIAERSRAGTGLLPPLALKWAAEQKELRKALGVVTDLDQSREWIVESMQILDKLLAVLDSERRAQLIPALQAAQTTRHELSNSLVGISGRLLATERSIVERVLDPDGLAALRTVLAERADLEPAYRQLPQLREEYEIRRGRMQGELGIFQQYNFRLRWEIEGMRRTLGGLREFLEMHPGTLPDAEDRAFREQVAQAEREVAALEGEQRSLEAEIVKQKSFIAASSTEEAEDRQLRAKYAATLARERDILSAVGGEITGAQAGFLAEIVKLRERLTNDHAEIERFGVQLGTLVAAKALELKASLLKEQSALQGYRDGVDSAHNDARRVVGEIAVASLRQVEETFKSIVLRGDVGVVDVAWALKDEKSQEITRKVAEQRREIQVLDREFKEILSDE